MYTGSRELIPDMEQVPEQLYQRAVCLPFPRSVRSCRGSAPLRFPQGCSDVFQELGCLDILGMDAEGSEGDLYAFQA